MDVEEILRELEQKLVKTDRGTYLNVNDLRDILSRMTSQPPTDLPESASFAVVRKQLLEKEAIERRLLDREAIAQEA